MISDTERREVARRLRSFVTDDSVYADVDACRVLHSIGLYYKDIDRIYFSGFDVAHLADLIEPDHVGDSTKMVDRDALLALADGLDKDADNIISAARNAQFTGSGPRMEEAKHDAYDWRQIARRIREALGESDG